MPTIRDLSRPQELGLLACERTAQGLQAECRGRGRVQKNFAERVAEIRAKLAPGTPVEIWRVGQKNKLTYRWARKRFTPPCRPRSTDPIDLSVRCGLPRTRSRCRPRAAGLQHRSYAASSRCDRNQNHSWRSRYSPPRSSRMAWRQGPQGSKQHLDLAAAATRARTQRPRKYLAIHAAELAIEPNSQIPRRYRRSLLLRLEHAHRAAVENHVHRAPRLGSRRSLNLRIGIRCTPDLWDFAKYY